MSPNDPSTFNTFRVPSIGFTTDHQQDTNCCCVALQEHLVLCRHALDGLQQKLYRINADIQLKTNSLMLDKQCLEAREKLQNNKLGATSHSHTSCELAATLLGVNRPKSQVIAY